MLTQILGLGSMSYWITPQTFAGSPEIPRWRLVENSDVRLTCNAKADPRFELLYSWYKMVRNCKSTKKMSCDK